ncbi:TonB-dependent receptor [Mucilaginibacter sp. JRF]|uniref:TonB-dependent receptor n=1 Tax=Mucilaginibacter sp. JRF TaxID=2780088 RepID=UPI00187E6DF5|nr:TonB-dependent receptor [Mucilaginibacter sp. JRF]MBE9583319.1 TonB-dependent receptor [Mucilaginibacter sp. JRF]
MKCFTTTNTLNKKNLTLFISVFGVFIFLASHAFAQTGNIRGRIADAGIDNPLKNATVTIAEDSTLKATTGPDGTYRLSNVPVGRKTLIITFIGYERTTIPNVDVSSGKDVVADVKLTEKFNSLAEVVISAGPPKDRPLNKLAAVSARQVSPEEISKFAGGRSDVARLATNFAGVSAPDDSRNDIIVRGNSPTGVLWRIEGIPVPSPNHFSSLGTTGSPVSALNVNVMGNSDFITSAFPGEYGNALGGVFDIAFRKGNKDAYEYTLSAGAFTGAEAMAEGPLGKKGSFLVAGRYGLAGLFGAGGTTAQPNYMDLSFNFDLGKTKIGNFSLFGIAASSNIDFRGDGIDESDLFAAKDENTDVKSQFGVLGLKHQISINDHSSIKTTIGGSSSTEKVDRERIFNYNTAQHNTLPFTNIDNNERRITLSSVYNARYNNRFTLRGGILLEQYRLRAELTTRERQGDANGDSYPDYINLINSDNNYTVFQPYVQGHYRLLESLTLNAGLHGQYFSLNKAFVAEPRASLSWKVAPAHSISFGYGLHHQNVPAPILFLNQYVNGSPVQSNKNLDLAQSNHYVLGYDVRPASGWRTKIEAYYQSISKAAVEATPSSYSSLTEGATFGFSIDKFGLVSKGTGRNTGVELTIEKFLSNGWYGLTTASVFEAKYKGSDGIERNSPFNNGYVVNVLSGKEFKVGSGRNVFFADTRLSTAGGRYYTPVDLAASRTAGYEILQDNNAFSRQYDAYFRMDIKLGMKLNSSRKKISHQFYIDLQNVTNKKNVFVRRYNRLTNNVDQADQIGLFPDFGYKLQF